MYWLGRANYVRWVIGVAIFGVALFAEFRPTNTVAHPFAASEIARGEPLAGLEWRQIPRGLLPMPDLNAAFAAVDLAVGEAVLPSHVAASGHVPGDWWSIPVAMPFAAPTGTLVHLVDTQTGLSTEGVVMAEPPNDPFAIEASALVAVPPESAAALAVAAAAGSITVVISSR